MNIGILLLTGFLGGMLAVAYLAILWWTVQRLPRQDRVGVSFLLSLLARLALVITGFYLILQGGHWDRLLAALGGFMIVKFIWLRRVKSTSRQSRTRTESPS